MASIPDSPLRTPGRFAEFVREYRFRILFLMVALLLVIYPFFSAGGPWRGYAFAVLFAGVLVVCALAGSVNRRQMILALCLVIPTFALHWLSIGLKHEDLTALVGIGYLLVVTHTILTVLWYVAVSRQVTPDVIAGAVSVYLLLGLNWAIAYALLDYVQPSDSIFRNFEVFAGDFTDYLYFSFTTLTTLGYGDIVPTDRYARALANMESVAGVLYLGAFVARLIAVYQHPSTRID